jgi:hypothetical protein
MARLTDRNAEVRAMHDARPASDAPIGKRYDRFAFDIRRKDARGAQGDTDPACFAPGRHDGDFIFFILHNSLLFSVKQKTHA